MWRGGLAEWVEARTPTAFNLAMAKYEIRTEIEIAASAATVWEILLDFRRHPEWNPFVRRIEGEAKVGERLTVMVKPANGNGMTFRPVVRVVAPEREFRWLGRFLVRGLFDGEHYFQIEPISKDRVRLIHGEHFSGLLVGLAQSGLESGTKAGFVAMNEALRARAEQRA